MKEDANRPRLPKLVIKSLSRASKEVCELEQAKDRLNFKSGIVLVDGRKVRSYDELVELVSQERYADKESIDVVLMPPLVGG
jgi:hypothetical protein